MSRIGTYRSDKFDQKLEVPTSWKRLSQPLSSGRTGMGGTSFVKQEEKKGCWCVKQTLSDLSIHNCHETRCPLGWLSAVDVSASKVHSATWRMSPDLDIFQTSQSGRRWDSFLCLVSHKKLLVVMGTEKESAQANIRLHTTLLSYTTLLDPRT